MGDEEKANPFTVLVCGGGNAAQVATAMFAARYKTIAISLYADEAAKWKAALGSDSYELTLDTGRSLISKPDDITNDPSVAAMADAIVLAVPSFAHGQYFEAFEPYIKPDTVVACMPARSGGDILLASKMGKKAESVIFVGFETLPWACRFTDWGKKATILGTKGSILAAVTPPAKTPKAFAALQGLLGVFPNVTESPNNLGISLRNPGAVIHPGVMYGRWCSEKWDGKPLAEKPLFYQGVEEFSESVLLGLTGEVQAIKNKMEEMIPGLNLKDAVHLKQWYLDCYAGQMTDTSSLRGCMNTNPGYRGLTHPMKETDGKYMPDLKYRYLAEDVPTGMCFNKGLAEILGIPTPMTDKVLAWAQECIGLKILQDGKMCGPDIGKTRAPQATGISTLDAFLSAAKIDKVALSKAPPMAASLPPPAESEEKNPFCVLVCGGGNAAQVATAMFASRVSTIAVSFFADEAARWKAALGSDSYELTLDTGKTLKSKPDDITNDPSVAAKADAIVLAVPSFAHGEYFEKFAPYMKPNTVVACMPARSGGDILFASKLGAKADKMVFMGFETLPWACRFTEWGRKATILGTKGSILAAVTPPDKWPLAYSTLQGLLGVFPNCTQSPSNLGISLRNPGAVIHPGVMYGRWCPEKWDGKPLAEKPLFYQGVEEFSEGVLLGLTGEVQAIKKKMEDLKGLDLTDACHLHQWYLDCYAGQMTDSSTLRGCMNTNPGYRGLTHPMKETDGKYMPDLRYRYLAEDVPTGMCFNKGLAEILGVPTPMTDKVLAWAQECIGLKILQDGKMCGPDIGKTRAPQAMGIHTVDDFCKAAKISSAGCDLSQCETFWDIPGMKAGVITGDVAWNLLRYAKAKNFAIPAFNCTGSSVCNAVLEAGAKIGRPVMIQFSEGGSAFFAGKALPNKNKEGSILGACAGAHYVRNISPAYGIPVIVHSDHCAKKLLPWFDGMLQADEEYFSLYGEPLFSSHMLDLSEEPHDENVSICAKYFKKMAPMNLILEMEIGITGGVEDGVDNSGVSKDKLYSTTSDVELVWNTLSPISEKFTIAAAFGNVHGVYKPGNVKLQPDLLDSFQKYLAPKVGIEKPFFFVFHGGSGSEKEDIDKAVSYGVVKMNVDTDTQWAYWEGLLKFYKSKSGYLQGQIGNPEGPEKPNKSYYDPRKWVRTSEETMRDRVIEGCKDLKNVY